MGAISNLYGFFSGQWQKAPIPFGISGNVTLRASNLSLAAGINTVNSVSVPSNRIWIITHIEINYVGTITNVTLRVQIVDVDFAYIFNELTVVSDKYYDRQGFWVISAGGKIRVVCTNATAGNDLYLTINGFYIDLAL